MSPVRSGHAEAYEKWFARYEIERKKRGIARGRNLPDFPLSPPGPDEVREVIFESINYLGERLAADLCNVHRTTILRWLDGSVQIPPSAMAILRFHAEGVPPGCGDHWRGFRWSGNTVTCPDGKTTLTAYEIAGIGYKEAYTRSLESRVKELELLLLEMTRRIPWGSANDPYQNGQDIRSRAFTSE